MTPDQLITLISQNGGVLGLAIFCMFMLNRVWDARVQEAKDHARDYQDLAVRVTVALEKQTIISTQLLERLRPA